MAAPDTATDRRPLSFHPGSLTVWDRCGGPPGVLFLLLTGAALLAAIDANTRQSFTMLLIAFPAWLVIGCLWVIRFGIGASWTRLRMPVSHWLRWLSVPLAMGAVFVITRWDAPFVARFDLSRPALDAMVADVMAGGPVDRGWVGLYEVGHVEAAPEGVRFAIDGAFARHGFAWTSAEDPSALETWPWCCDEYEPVGDGWWRWYEAISD